MISKSKFYTYLLIICLAIILLILLLVININNIKNGCSHTHCSNGDRIITAYFYNMNNSIAIYTNINIIADFDNDIILEAIYQENNKQICTINFLETYKFSNKIKIIISNNKECHTNIDDRYDLYYRGIICVVLIGTVFVICCICVGLFILK